MRHLTIALLLAACTPYLPVDLGADAAVAPVLDTLGDVVAADVPGAEVVVLDGVVWITDTPADAGTDAGTPDAADAPTADAGAVEEAAADAGTPDAGVVDVPPACGALEGLCDGACRSLLIDPQHCGACGRACPSGDHATGACNGGACTLVCAEGYAPCGAGCIDVRSDHANCGACGRGCGAAEVCRAGACVGCPSGEDACANACIDANTNPNNCGNCGRVCGASQVCSGGNCAFVTCGPLAGDVMCGSRCLNILTDRENCGGCGRSCGVGQVCAFGACDGR